MPIIAKANGENFILCPAGTHAAVCVDVVDLGMVTSEFAGEKKTQHKVRIVWQVEEAQENGKPFTAQKRYTLSLHEKAALRKDLEAWRGKSFTAPELEGFDLERLVGVGAFINVIHDQRNGKTYDNVASIMKLPSRVPAPAPQGYVRVCDRQQQPAVPSDTETYAPSDDDVPF